MNRRAFLFASLVASPVLSGMPGAARAAPDIQVIYIGGQDCGACQRWRVNAHPRWLASDEIQKVSYFEIEPINLKDAYDERSWPRGLRAILAQVPRKSGTPRFLIVQVGRIVSNQLGVSAWTSTLADLKQFVE
ncbi:MAG TPA: hypothetical protein VK634_02740 [Reyranella sp.]|nr:hypothetical protein [Reyranella sp.]HTE79590.1 hypothetical protein [Reyranella sp.]